MVKALDIRGADRSAGAGLASLVGGATASLRSALGQSLAKATEMLFKQGYKSAEELEADETGLILATLSGYDPQGLGRFLERVGRFEPGVSTSATHPLHGERLRALTAAEATLNVRNRALYARHTERFQNNAH
jgi:predicted Zn-dependent protease